MAFIDYNQRILRFQIVVCGPAGDAITECMDELWRGTPADELSQRKRRELGGTQVEMFSMTPRALGTIDGFALTFKLVALHSTTSDTSRLPPEIRALDAVLFSDTAAEDRGAMRTLRASLETLGYQPSDVPIVQLSGAFASLKNVARALIQRYRDRTLQLRGPRFAKGDRVVLAPTGVMMIAAVCHRHEVPTGGKEHFELQAPRALEGESPLVPTVDDEQVYALRWVDDEEVSFTVPVMGAAHHRLRRVASKDEAEAFIARLRSELAEPHHPLVADEVGTASAAAGNDLHAIAPLYAKLCTGRDAAGAERLFTSLTKHLVEELSLSQSISMQEARAQLLPPSDEPAESS